MCERELIGRGYDLGFLLMRKVLELVKCKFIVLRMWYLRGIYK